MARKSCAKAHFLPRMGHGLGQLDVQEMGTSPKVAKGQRKAPLSDRKAVLLWLRGLDLNQRPPGYEKINCGYSAGPLNVYNTGIAQEIAGLPTFSGIWLRVLLMVGAWAIAVFFTVRHWLKVKKSGADNSSLLAQFNVEEERAINMTDKIQCFFRFSEKRKNAIGYYPPGYTLGRPGKTTCSGGKHHERE